MKEKKNTSTTIAAPLHREPVTKKEVWAWWLYMVAIEPVSIVVLQLLMPLILDSLAAIYGHLPGQPGVKCPDGQEGPCVLFQIFGLDVSGTAFTYAILTLSVALQAIVFVLFGALADYGSTRRVFLGIVTFSGMATCCAVLLVGGRFAALIGGVLNVLLTLFFGVALMLYNSYLPILAENHPEVLNFQSEKAEEMLKRREVVSQDLSTKSYMLGYGAAVLVLVATAAFLYGAGQSFLNLQLAVVACGCWWGLGSIYPLIALKPRPGPPLPANANVFTFSVVKTFQTLKKSHKLPNLFRYLFCYFLFADGCNTLGTVAVLLARSVLKAPVTMLVQCAILAPVAGVLGNFFFFFVQKKFELSSKAVLIGILSCVIGLTAYGSAGIFTTSFGLRHQWECYLMAGTYGFLIGAMQSFSRVIYGEMIPPGEESEFFALYAITDKGSSWIGPAIQALIDSFTTEPRLGILALGIMIILPFPILIMGVDPAEGKRQAQKYYREQQSAIDSENPAMTEVNKSF